MQQHRRKAGADRHPDYPYAEPDTWYEQEQAPNVSNFERGLSVGIGALLVWSAIRRFPQTPVRSLLRSGLGAWMIVRGATGNCPVYERLGVDGTRRRTTHIQAVFTVNKPREEVYRAWRNLSDLPRFMKHLKSVRENTHGTSHWEATFPEGNPIAIRWDAEIVKDEPGTLLAWKSLPGSVIDNAGKVEFRDALGHQGTEIRVTIIYRPPAGNIGSGIARLFNPVFRRLVRQDILGFKEYIEMRKDQPATVV